MNVIVVFMFPFSLDLFLILHVTVDVFSLSLCYCWSDPIISKTENATHAICHIELSAQKKLSNIDLQSVAPVPFMS